jgi:hypothetical protein
MRLACVVVVLAAALLNTEIAGQQVDIAGAWTLDAPAASGQTPQGGNWSTAAQTGTLTFTLDGVSVTGTWQGRMPQPWPLAGELKGDRLDVETEFREVSVSINGETAVQKRRWRFRGVAAGDTITGTMSFDTESRPGPDQPFTAKRSRP